MAAKLNLSLSGYSKIERDETDITIKRLQQIAKILDTELATLLNFDSNQVFNQYNNKTALANGVVQNQQVITDEKVEDQLKRMNEEIMTLKGMMSKIQYEK